MTEPILPLRPEVTVWGIRDSHGRPHIRQANDAEMERFGLDAAKFQPWSDGFGSDLGTVLARKALAGQERGNSERES